MAKKINVRLDDKMEKCLKDIQAYYSELTGLTITESGALRIAIVGEIQHIKEMKGEEAPEGRAIFL